ncbi:MAG: NAD(P)/FAD-dependent oxidoreductase [Pseudomonadota bacterium]
MERSKYLIVGSSHAGLAALDAIRLQDRDGRMTLVTQEEALPYSPTILPYLVSGKVKAEKVFLRDEGALDRLGVTFRRRAKVVALDPGAQTVHLDGGEILGFEKLLLATGAEPVVPPIEGLQETPYHVLRTLEDGLRLRSAMGKANQTVVLGAGLIGMHAAENLAKGGVQVTVVEALPQVLPGYFDQDAAALIQKAFTEEGVRIMTGAKVTRVAEVEGKPALTLANGETLSADLLLVSVGVKPRIEYLQGSGVNAEEGILVDERMRTNLPGIWAAGDVAQAKGFFSSGKRVNATLPSAVEQGRIAGMDMVGDPTLKTYAGGIALNSYKFFGHRAFAVGLSAVPKSGDGFEVDQVFLPTSLRYQKLVFKDDRLVGACGINSDLDPGIMCQLIRRGVDLSAVKSRFSAAPLETSRYLMSIMWR